MSNIALHDLSVLSHTSPNTLLCSHLLPAPCSLSVATSLSFAVFVDSITPAPQPACTIIAAFLTSLNELQLPATERPALPDKAAFESAVKKLQINPL